VLLAALPYVATIALYWLTTSGLIKDAEGEAPSNWNWRLVAPVLVGGLTPLALAASDSVTGSNRTFLLSTTALAILFTVLLMAALQVGSGFFKLQRPISIGSLNLTRFPRWRLILVVGTAILCYGAVTNVIVAGKTEAPNSQTPSVAPKMEER